MLYYSTMLIPLCGTYIFTTAWAATFVVVKAARVPHGRAAVVRRRQQFSFCQDEHFSVAFCQNFQGGGGRPMATIFKKALHVGNTRYAVKLQRIVNILFRAPHISLAFCQSGSQASHAA